MAGIDEAAYAAMLQDVFARRGRRALKKAIEKDPIRFVREIRVVLARITPESEPEDDWELDEAELDERGRLLLRALGRDRMARLMDEPEGGGG